MKRKNKTTAPKTNDTPTRVPKLRFPEFRGAEGWDQKAIGEVCTSFSGGTPSTSQKDYYGGNIPFIRSAEINRTETELFLSDAGLNNSAAKLVAKGDVLIALYGANSGDVALGKITGAINQAILCLKSESSNAFIYHFLSHRQSWIINTYLQGGQGNLSGDIVKSITLGFPSPLEQQKIAACLSSLDERVAAQARRVDALKTHKKGLMQQLFPREGETHPLLRFPEFQNAGEWQRNRLGGFCRIRTGKKDANEGAADGIYPFFTCAEKHIYSHNFSFDAEAILIAGNANVGQTNYYNGKFEAYQRTYVLTDFKGIFVPYLYAILNANLRPDLLAQVQVSAMSYIRLPMLEEYQICAPTSQDEQHRIASCLGSLDALITAETQKLEALKAHKKGLMQQLFPSPEKVEP